MEISPLALISGQNGTLSVNDTDAVTDNFVGFKVDAEAVIASLGINGAAADVKANYITTPATSLAKDTLVVARGNDYFSSIQLTSGKVTLILAD